MDKQKSDGSDFQIFAAATTTASGGAALLGGVGCIGAGAALTATGIFAPVGVVLLVGGTIGSLLGAASTAGGAAGIGMLKNKK